LSVNETCVTMQLRPWPFDYVGARRYQMLRKSFWFIPDSRRCLGSRCSTNAINLKRTITSELTPHDGDWIGINCDRKICARVHYINNNVIGVMKVRCK